MTEYDKYHERMMNNKEFRKEYDALESQYELINALIDARKEKRITQKRLSEMTGITQAHISNIERGIKSPSLEIVWKLADALGLSFSLKIDPLPDKTII